MIDPVKDFLAPKRFSIAAYLCIIVYFLCGLVLIVVTVALRDSENWKFSCFVDGKSTAMYKEQVDQACFARYDQTYISPLPLYGFVLLSIGFTVVVSVIYSLLVSTRVDEIKSSYERKKTRTTKENEDYENEDYVVLNRGTFVIYFYFIHLVLRALFMITLTILQHSYFYPNGFDSKFSCNLPPTNQVTSNINTPKNANGTLVTCKNATASEKWLTGVIVSVLNSIVAAVILGEVIYLLPRLPIFNRYYGVGWSCDSKFVIEYLLGKPYNVPGENESLTNIENNPPDYSTQDYSTPDSFAENDSIQHFRTQDSINFYKQQVLNRCRETDIYYGPKACLDDFYIDVVIHTERAQHEFSKEMNRHEIYDIHTEVPSNSIRLENIKDLFNPNEDTKSNFPRSILANGRPGIGKTALTEKILRDWANEIDEYYSDKIAFFFKLRWFNDKLTNLSLKTFLQLGTRLNEEKFESIYEEIAKEPQKAILIFDGLDELHGNPISCLDQSKMIPDDPNTCMSAMNLFINLMLGNLLKGATVLVTSRPTADDFYSRLHFDRNVEITGFTWDKIEEYVSRFCDNNNRSDLESRIWKHIKSSPGLSNLCYTPVNCFIVCVILFECLSDPRNDIGAPPTTLTELYKTAVNHFEKYHHTNADKNPTMTEEALKELQRLAFDGMENGQHVFNQELFDEQMKTSGLLNSLSNPIFPIQTQFCFIHLTIQEFLAARHVTETLATLEIKKFIFDHVKSGKWHLVLQFLAGLLGKKIKNFDKEYTDCVFAFAERFEVTHGKIELNYNEVLVMTCLREVDDEEIVKSVCETTALNDVVHLHGGSHIVSPSEWAARKFVCKHMKNLELNKNANQQISDKGEYYPSNIRSRSSTIITWNLKYEIYELLFMSLNDR
jgi:hypothetical protein